MTDARTPKVPPLPSIRLLERIREEADYGLHSSRTHKIKCNAQRALEIVIALLDGDIPVREEER